MAVQRVFYVTQERLRVWRVRRGAVSEGPAFSSDPMGAEAFARYVLGTADQSARILVDVIEEEFSVGSVPQLPRRDRSALLERRLSRKYSRTPFRLAAAHRGELENGEQRVVYCAVSNDELLTPWLAAIQAARMPLAGITSVPLLAHQVWRSATELTGKALLISQHEQSKLRLVYLRDGELTSARLSRVPPLGSEDYSQQVAAEVQKSRRYLERARLLRPGESLAACILADEDTVKRIANHNQDTNVRLKSVDPQSIGKAMRMATPPHADRSEVVYVLAAARLRRGQDYAPPEVTRQHRLHLGRRAAIAALVVGALSAALVTGLNFSNSLELGRSVVGMREQTERMELTFRREHEEFSSTQAESREMKAAVDAGDFILANRVPVDLVLRELGTVLGDFPELHIEGLEWQVDGYTDATPTGRNQPTRALKAVDSLTAELYGEIRPYDGDLLRAFAVVDRLVAALTSRSRFDVVQAIEYPLDASPQSSVAGELVGAGSSPVAPFRLRLTMAPEDRELSDDAA